MHNVFHAFATFFHHLQAVSWPLVAWALAAGVLPGVHVLHRLPAIDWFWLFEHPRLAIAVLIGAVAASFVLGVLAARRIEAFGRRVAQGFAIVRSPGRYLTGVA